MHSQELDHRLEEGKEEPEAKGREGNIFKYIQFLARHKADWDLFASRPYLLLAQLQAPPAYEHFHMPLIILYLDPIKTFLNKQSMLAIATESHMLATKMPVCLCENEMLLEWRHISTFERSPNKLQDPPRLFYSIDADCICSRRQEYESLLWNYFSHYL